MGKRVKVHAASHARLCTVGQQLLKSSETVATHTLATYVHTHERLCSTQCPSKGSMYITHSRNCIYDVQRHAILSFVCTLAQDAVCNSTSFSYHTSGWGSILYELWSYRVVKVCVWLTNHRKRLARSCLTTREREREKVLHSNVTGLFMHHYTIITHVHINVYTHSIFSFHSTMQQHTQHPLPPQHSHWNLTRKNRQDY